MGDIFKIIGDLGMPVAAAFYGIDPTVINRRMKKDPENYIILQEMNNDTMRYFQPGINLPIRPLTSLSDKSSGKNFKNPKKYIATYP